MAAAGAPAGPPAASRRAAELIRDCSFEISPRDEWLGERLRGLFDAGTEIFVSHPASATHHDIVAACTRLRRAGFVPVPHVAARRLATLTQAGDFLRRAAGEAEVTAILLVAGDPPAPVGPFADSLGLLASGVVERCGIARVFVAGYPEGHPQIGAAALAAALDAKLALARRLGLAVGAVTQFGFDAAPIGRWLAGLRARGIDCPVRVGVAGPASIATLAGYAVRCGVGASLRALARGHTAFARILTETGPDALIAALVEAEATAGRIDGLHVFTFGGVRRAAAWRRAAMA
jgi:methylenetetrahydrofolate reductase (NADPH)